MGREGLRNKTSKEVRKAGWDNGKSLITFVRSFRR
jgi:hypothetical protein